MSANTLSQSPYAYSYSSTFKLRLEMVGGGHNKFYEMTTIHASNKWVAHYGRIGNSAAQTTYSSSDWLEKLSEKIKKGYVVVMVDTKTTLSQNQPQTPDPPKNPVKTEATFIKKINLLIDKLKSHKMDMVVFNVEQMKQTYLNTGVLTVKDMEYMNGLYRQCLKEDEKQVAV